MVWLSDVQGAWKGRATEEAMEGARVAIDEAGKRGTAMDGVMAPKRGPEAKGQPEGEGPSQVRGKGPEDAGDSSSQQCGWQHSRCSHRQGQYEGLGQSR